MNYELWTMKPFALQLGYALVSISAIVTDVCATLQLMLRVFTLSCKLASAADRKIYDENQADAIQVSKQDTFSASLSIIELITNVQVINVIKYSLFRMAFPNEMNVLGFYLLFETVKRDTDIMI